ncbi:hypothetical protein ACJIZ3_017313 [Penstemon smallii]|uniref:BHLH domain-containing protein n=1 Tax=Penstemon smallii TaxID=265156 RepID=A0ABD3SVS9_9LAMI
MERTNKETEMVPSNVYANDFGIVDFMDEPNFDQFIDLYREENAINPIVNFSNQGYDCDQHNNIVGGCLVDDQLFSPLIPQIDLFDLDHVANVSMNFGLQNEYPNEAEEEEEESIDEEGSSATTTTNTRGKKKNNKVDRSRTLISERKRRSRMKEKLYALRALVPNITKMDKASIVGDAVLYVQDLQMKAKKLKTEIAGLESSLTGGGDKRKGRTNQDTTKKSNVTNFSPIIKKILKMDVYQVEERGFYVRILCRNEKGVAVLLYRALDSMTNFNVQTSNLAASEENYVFTFTLHVSILFHKAFTYFGHNSLFNIYCVLTKLVSLNRERNVRRWI